MTLIAKLKKSVAFFIFQGIWFDDTNLVFFFKNDFLVLNSRTTIKKKIIKFLNTPSWYRI
jgi:hypothetical protein